MEKKKYIKPGNKTLNMYADEMMVDIIITSNPNQEAPGAKEKGVWDTEEEINNKHKTVWDD